MKSANESLVHTLTASLRLVERYVEDLTPAEMLHRPTPMANPVAWTMGHLVLTERRVLTLFGATDLPPLPDGFERRFARDDVAPRADLFGDTDLLLPLFERHRTMLIATVAKAPPEQLAVPVPKPHPLFATLGEMAGFMALHATMHAGQFTIIRRSLGKPPLI